MKLDLNFGGLTKLRDWWKQVYNNFNLIEKDCNEIRKIADDACTKEEARQYVAEFAKASPEYMEAINNFSKLYEENGSSIAALESLLGDRLRYYNHTSEFDADTANDDSVHFCRGTTLNTPTLGQGILLNVNSAFKLWITSDGKSYNKTIGNEWKESGDKELIQNITNSINILQTSKSEVVFGVYQGDGAEERIINLGFTPAAVELYPRDGRQYSDFWYYGGFAIKGFSCGFSTSTKWFEIVDNGFKVSKPTLGGSAAAHCNETGTTYYFTAYKNGSIMQIT